MMLNRNSVVLTLLMILTQISLCWCQEAIKTEVVRKRDGSWQLVRGGKPYQIRGAGGEASLKLLASIGGNSTRTWGVDEGTLARLDEAHRHGISVTVGLWLEHERHGFNYTDFDQVSEQIDKSLAAVKKLKDHPAVLAWGIGNEMEGGNGANPAIWSHVEFLASEIKKLDPNHPTMTVIAEIGSAGEKVKAINKLCPSIDLIGVNSYGGATSLPERLAKTKSAKPYVVTEFGPIGPWEVPENSVDSVDELNSGQKVAQYQKALQQFESDQGKCLGYYAFLWGAKQEATATWFGLLLPDGRRTAAVDVLQHRWTGKQPKNLCPEIVKFTLEGGQLVDPGQSLLFELQTRDPDRDSLKVDWVMMKDAKSYVTGGDFQKSPDSMPNQIKSTDARSAKAIAPAEAGLYRMYVYVTDPTDRVATGNIVFRVKGEPVKAGTEVTLPLVIMDEPGENRPFIASGFMGEVEQIKLNDQCSDNPKFGKSCIECRYQSKQGWGGVVWQHPADDWGDLPDGIDLRGATRLTFWARGQEGEETISFGFGVLGRDKKYFDTAKASTEIHLTDEWKQYTIKLDGKDLTRIKTGFFWSLAADGRPRTFYLDRIQFE